VKILTVGGRVSCGQTDEWSLFTVLQMYLNIAQCWETVLITIFEDISEHCPDTSGYFGS